ncbi:MAG: histidine--tRNA ligase, partial [Armatimonadetes bacterium]|nr:histidine--tRNA ligase [Armatimonadota bacterium]
LVPHAKPRHGCLVITMGDAAWTEGIKLVAELRKAGVEAELDYRQRSMRAQMKFANNYDFATVVLLGEDEMSRGVMGLRDLETAEQVEVTREELVARLQGR